MGVVIASLVAAGAFLIVYALLGSSGSLPAGPLVIPPNVGTAAPAPATAPTAAPLPASDPMRIEIPALDVSAPVMRLCLAPDGSAGWYTRSVTPGQQGTSMILGHVDSYTGESVFFNIKNLRPGDQIKVVRADGTTATFTVDGVQKVEKSTFPGAAIYANTSYPSLRLITCGGPFDSGTASTSTTSSFTRI